MGLTNTKHRGNKTLAALKSSFKHEFLHTKISKHFRRIIHTGKVYKSEISLLLTVKNQTAASLSLAPGKYHPTSVCEPRLCAHPRSDFPSALGSLSAVVRQKIDEKQQARFHLPQLTFKCETCVFLVKFPVFLTEMERRKTAAARTHLL